MYWTLNLILEVARPYKTRKEFQQKNKRAYAVAQRKDWLDFLYWMPKPHYWTYIDCYMEAKKYTTKKDFNTKAKGAYFAAWTNDWLKKFTWLEDGRKTAKKNTRFTFLKCTKIIKTCKSKREFYTQYPSAYHHAVEHNWLHDLYVIAGFPPPREFY